AINPTGTRLYVANAGAGTVSVVDTATNVVIATVTVGSFPFGVAVNPTGTRVYVANGGAGGGVSVIDTASNTVVATVPVPSAAGIAITPNGARAYVADFAFNSVQVIDTATNTVVATITGGFSRPIAFGIFIAQAASVSGIPTLSTWGMIVLVLSLLAIGTWQVRRASAGPSPSRFPASER
ncbi:MAG TPA: IPTL-CTERM sorting domain-containing protein, partial [Candidatus Acidoferrum sp.]|nr:IPTL-CTERM sorting domain-containing protein [Candidatus Acidoferrum sp.]